MKMSKQQWIHILKVWAVPLVYLVCPVDILPFNPADDAVVLAIAGIIEGVCQLKRIYTAS